MNELKPCPFCGERQYSNYSMTGFSTTQEYGVVVSCLTGAEMKRENKPLPLGTAE